MTTNKLKLKRTPEEEAARKAKKEKKREKKRKREENHDSSFKRHHTDEYASGPSRKWASSDEEELEHGPHPSKSNWAEAVDYEALKAEIEDRRFREKMFDALDDDERLDGLEARLNDYVPIPQHWRSSGTAKAQAHDEDEFLRMNPATLDDEEYAEWVRIGMYRKTHADEYAEQQRKKAERAARKAEQKAHREEAKKMEKLAAEEDQHKKTERDMRKSAQAREEYQHRWTALLASANDNDAQVLAFRDIPWPVLTAYRRREDMQLNDLNLESVSSFLQVKIGTEDERKRRIREAILRFHPDKFEGRFLKRIKSEDLNIVRDGVRQVIGILNTFL